MRKRTKTDTPQYLVHKATGVAYCNIAGRRIYFSKDGPDARVRYHRCIAEWLANGLI